MNPSFLIKDSKRLHLLENRISGEFTSPQQDRDEQDRPPTEPQDRKKDTYPEKSKSPTTSALGNSSSHTITTYVDSNLPSPGEVIIVDGSKSRSDSKSNSSKNPDSSSAKENVKINIAGKPSQRSPQGQIRSSASSSGSKRPFQEDMALETSRSMHGREKNDAQPSSAEKAAKQTRRTEHAGQAAGPAGDSDSFHALHGDGGSRGAVTNMRKIHSYFIPANPEQSSFRSNTIFNSSNNTTTAAGNHSEGASGNGGSGSGSGGDAAVSAAEITTTISASSNSAANLSARSSTAATVAAASKPGAVIVAAAAAPSTTTVVDATQLTAAMQQNQQHLTTIAELKKTLDVQRQAKEIVQNKLLRLEEQLGGLGECLRRAEDRGGKLTGALEEVYRKKSQQEARRKREKLAQDCLRLGRITTMRTGPTTVGDVWEEGYALKDLSKRANILILRKEELEQRRKKVQALRRAASKKSSSSSTGGSGGGAAGVGGEIDIIDAECGAGGGGGGGESGAACGSAGNGVRDSTIDMELDVTAESEAIKSHLEQLKRDEQALAEERRILEGEKAVHQKELKRCQCEERSRFYKDLPVLHKRYLLQSMLGRGGFSEVWKALDLTELREVAVKVHELNPAWSEERKQSYVKHVTREYTIHRDMRHPRVVQLFDVFEIDINSFATVLEYCRGIDLDEKLKRQKTLPEKDARVVFMQIMSGLRYLNRPLSYNAPSTGAPATTVAGASDAASAAMGGGVSAVMGGGVGDAVQEDRGTGRHSPNRSVTGGLGAEGPYGGRASKKLSIIHFDLKPANILFDEAGDVKITDFGLSKIIDESSEGTSVELTSQGAGTYWYLPPECFAKGCGPNAPKISSKVDVWSAGIIFYQMLYGTRPYGEGRTQENVWNEGLIYNASAVQFPSTAPGNAKVSEEAKEVIRQCLTRDQKYRPDVLTVCQHPYLNK